METLRRLRIVWTILCALGAAAYLFAGYGGTPQEVVVLGVIAAALFALVPYQQTAVGIVSVLWFAAVSVFLLSVAEQRRDVVELFMGGLFFGFGGWAAISAVAWVVTPLFKRKPSVWDSRP
jgi:hypothetical protein